MRSLTVWVCRPANQAVIVAFRSLHQNLFDLTAQAVTSVAVSGAPQG